MKIPALPGRDFPPAGPRSHSVAGRRLPLVPGGRIRKQPGRRSVRLSATPGAGGARSQNQR